MVHFEKNVERRVFQTYIAGLLLFIHLYICFAKTSTNIASKNKVQIESIQGYSLKNITDHLSKEFNDISNEELGVSEIQVNLIKS